MNFPALDFGKSLISNILLTLINSSVGRVWHWLKAVRPSRMFWRTDPTGKVVVVMSLPVFLKPDSTEHAVYVPSGDTLAFGEILALLRTLYPSTRTVFHRNPDDPLSFEEWDATVVLIGGGKSNLTTRCILAALDPPAYGRDHEHDPGYDSKKLKDRQGNVILEPDFDRGRLSVDYGYVIRAPNPHYSNRFVYILVGAHTHGTHGAAHWASQPANLFWLARDTLKARLAERLRRRSRPDSVEVVLRVPAVGQVSDLDIPAISQVSIWHQEGRKLVYHFQAPSTDEYQMRYESCMRTFASRNVHSATQEGS